MPFSSFWYTLTPIPGEIKLMQIFTPLCEAQTLCLYKHTCAQPHLPKHHKSSSSTMYYRIFPIKLSVIKALFLPVFRRCLHTRLTDSPSWGREFSQCLDFQTPAFWHQLQVPVFFVYNHSFSNLVWSHACRNKPLTNPVWALVVSVLVGQRLYLRMSPSSTHSPTHSLTHPLPRHQL